MGRMSSLHRGAVSGTRWRSSAPCDTILDRSGTLTTPCTGLTLIVIGGSGTADAMTTEWLPAVPHRSSTAPAIAEQVIDWQVSGGATGSGTVEPGLSIASAQQENG